MGVIGDIAILRKGDIAHGGIEDGRRQDVLIGVVVQIRSCFVFRVGWGIRANGRDILPIQGQGGIRAIDDLACRLVEFEPGKNQHIGLARDHSQLRRAIGKAHQG